MHHFSKHIFFAMLITVQTIFAGDWIKDLEWQGSPIVNAYGWISDTYKKDAIFSHIFVTKNDSVYLFDGENEEVINITPKEDFGTVNDLNEEFLATSKGFFRRDSLEWEQVYDSVVIKIILAGNYQTYIVTPTKIFSYDLYAQNSKTEKIFELDSVDIKDGAKICNIMEDFTNDNWNDKFSEFLLSVRTPETNVYREKIIAISSDTTINDTVIWQSGLEDSVGFFAGVMIPTKDDSKLVIFKKNRIITVHKELPSDTIFLKRNITNLQNTFVGYTVAGHARIKFDGNSQLLTFSNCNGATIVNGTDFGYSYLVTTAINSMDTLMDTLSQTEGITIIGENARINFCGRGWEIFQVNGLSGAAASTSSELYHYYDYSVAILKTSNAVNKNYNKAMIKNGRVSFLNPISLNSSVEIVNLQGRVVFHKKLSAGVMGFNINSTVLGKGTYLLRVNKGGSHSWEQKMVLW